MPASAQALAWRPPAWRPLWVCWPSAPALVRFHASRLLPVWARGSASHWLWARDVARFPSAHSQYAVCLRDERPRLSARSPYEEHSRANSVQEPSPGGSRSDETPSPQVPDELRPVARSPDDWPPDDWRPRVCYCSLAPDGWPPSLHRRARRVSQPDDLPQLLFLLDEFLRDAPQLLYSHQAPKLVLPWVKSWEGDTELRQPWPLQRLFR